MKCVILTTDTRHHKYFCNSISEVAETNVILERRRLDYRKLYWKWMLCHKGLWSFVDNPYLHLAYKKFNRLQDEFEKQLFTGADSTKFDNQAAIHDFYSVNDSECVQLVSNIHPDLIVSFGTLLIGRDMINLDILKVNIHRGILPKYRGLDSDLWAFYYRDFNNVGTTVHVIEPRFDTGNILHQERLNISSDVMVHHIRYHTTVMATNMVRDIIQRLKNNESVNGYPQDLSRSQYYPYIPPVKRFIAIKRLNKYISSL